MLPARSGRLRSALLTAFWRGEKEMKIERKSACRCGCAGGLNLLCTDEGVSEGEGESKKNKTLGGCGCAIGQIVRHTVEGLLGRAKRYQNLKNKTLADAAAQSGRMCSALLKAFCFGERKKK